MNAGVWLLALRNILQGEGKTKKIIRAEESAGIPELFFRV